MVGTIYLIHRGDFIGFNMNIYKLGKTVNYKRRMKEYPFFTEEKYKTEVNNHDEIETILLLKFKIMFKKRSDFGNEYFEGDVCKMIEVIEKIINKDTQNNINYDEYINKLKNINKLRHQQPIKIHKKYSLQNINEYLRIPDNKIEEYKEYFVDQNKLAQHYNICNYFLNENFEDSIKKNNDFKINYVVSIQNKLAFLKKFCEKCNIYENDEDIINVREAPTKEISDELSVEYAKIYRFRGKTLDFTNKLKILEYLKNIYEDLFGNNIIKNLKKIRINNKTITPRQLNRDLINANEEIYNYRLYYGEVNKYLKIPFDCVNKYKLFIANNNWLIQHYCISHYFFGEDSKHLAAICPYLGIRNIQIIEKKIEFLKKFCEKCNIYENNNNIFNVREVPAKEVFDELFTEYTKIYKFRGKALNFINVSKILEYLKLMYNDLFGSDIIHIKRITRNKKTKKYKQLNRNLINANEEIYFYRRNLIEYYGINSCMSNLNLQELDNFINKLI